MAKEVFRHLRALRTVGLDEAVRALPDGLDTALDQRRRAGRLQGQGV